MLSKLPPEFLSNLSNLHSQQAAGGTQFFSGVSLSWEFDFGSVHMASRQC